MVRSKVEKHLAGTGSQSARSSFQFPLPNLFGNFRDEGFRLPASAHNPDRIFVSSDLSLVKGRTFRIEQLQPEETVESPDRLALFQQ